MTPLLSTTMELWISCPLYVYPLLMISIWFMAGPHSIFSWFLVTITSCFALRTMSLKDFCIVSGVGL